MRGEGEGDDECAREKNNFLEYFSILLQIVITFASFPYVLEQFRTGRF